MPESGQDGVLGNAADMAGAAAEGARNAAPAQAGQQGGASKKVDARRAGSAPRQRRTASGAARRTPHTAASRRVDKETAAKVEEWRVRQASKDEERVQHHNYRKQFSRTPKAYMMLIKRRTKKHIRQTEDRQQRSVAETPPERHPGVIHFIQITR